MDVWELMKESGFGLLSEGLIPYQKNFLRLMQAHKRLLGEGLQHDQCILGAGSERPMLEQYVAENGLQDSVWMPGFMENPYPFMREADLLACSSIYEGYSTFMTEGIILGKPIVTTDVSGMRELLGDSEFGLIVENDDEAFYQGMKRMLTERELREIFSEKAVARGRDFSAEQLTRKTEAFFEELIGESN